MAVGGTKPAKSSGTKVLFCPCTPHVYQDRKHGNNMRVHNACEKGWRCTVCGKVK